MAIYYHGTSSLFREFSMEHLFEGKGNYKFGIGIYLSESYKTAAHYAIPSADVHYIYTVECPDLTDDNHLVSVLPVNESLVKRVEKKLGCTIPQRHLTKGKYFRKFIGNTVLGKKPTFNKASVDAEKAASAFLKSIGVEFLIWPRAQRCPNGEKNIAVLNTDNIKILKIEKVKLDSKGRLIPNSQIEITL